VGHGARCIFLLNLCRTIYFCKIVKNKYIKKSPRHVFGSGNSPAGRQMPLQRHQAGQPGEQRPAVEWRRPHSPGLGGVVFVSMPSTKLDFLYLFYHVFAKIYGPPQILQKYTSAVVTHGARDITLWSTAVGAARSGPVPLMPRATVFCP
jgi:hypothetical protein